MLNLSDKCEERGRALSEFHDKPVSGHEFGAPHRYKSAFYGRSVEIEVITCMRCGNTSEAWRYIYEPET